MDNKYVEKYRCLLCQEVYDILSDADFCCESFDFCYACSRCDRVYDDEDWANECCYNEKLNENS